MITQPKIGTREHINFCMYMIDTCKNPATKNLWARRAEESEYLLYVDGTRLDKGENEIEVN